MTIAPVATSTSITHQHLSAVVNTEIRRLPGRRALRVLDLGCGDGRLLLYLATNLPILNPEVHFELYGLDVEDPGVQRGDFLGNARRRLSERCPNVDWDRRIVSISTGDHWPYDSEYFDAVISNQVLEHVQDHEFLFRELARTLQRNGWSAHLFPLLHYFYEGHLHLPFVHRFRNFDLLQAYIRTLSRMGLGKFREHRQETGISLEAFTERHADYMNLLTNYLTYRDVLRLARRSGFRASFRYTAELYKAKLRSVLGCNAIDRYAIDRSALYDWLAVFVCKYLSGVTLFLENRQTYRIRDDTHG